MKRMFFEWAIWQFKAGRTKMGLTTLDIIGPYWLERLEFPAIAAHIKTMLLLVGKEPRED